MHRGVDEGPSAAPGTRGLGHHEAVNLLPTPEVTLSDADVADALERAVGIINPLLDVLYGTDPLGLKRRDTDLDDGPLDKVADGLSWALSVADVPGTRGWDNLDTAARIRWWVRRVGTLNTVVVASPGVFGALARGLPIQDLLGFVNQAIVLCAVARELGVTNLDTQVRMLAEVLCERDLSGVECGEHLQLEPLPRTPLGVAKALWQLAGLFDAIGDEIAKRPHPRKPLRYLAMLPGIGGAAAFFGERRALERAAEDACRWLEDHPHGVGEDSGPSPQS